MKWGAHEIDGRLAAYNAIKIRAALRQSINATMIYQAYLNTQPYKSDNVTQDRAKARAWAIINVSFNNEAITEILRNVWAEAYVLGESSALDAVRQAKELKKVDAVVDWSKWKAGSEAKELLVRPKGSFKKILSEANITIRNLNRVGYEKIGNALADSFALGLSASSSAKLILNTIADPARALTIAITENSRVQNLAAIDTYKELGLEKYEWSAADPCEICAENDGQIVTMDEVFDSGDEAPPAHPNCRCVLLPVVDGMEESGGSSIEQFDELTTDIDEQGVARISPSAVGQADVVDIADNSYSQIMQNAVSPYAWDFFREQEQPNWNMRGMVNAGKALRSYVGNGYTDINSSLRGQRVLRDNLPQSIRGQKPSPIIKEIKNMDKIFKAAKPISQDIYTWRGTGTRRGYEQMIALKVGDSFTEPAFYSTSLSQSVTKGFGGNKFIIKVIIPKDTKLLPVRSFHSNLSPSLAMEQEVILNRGSTFTVLETTAKEMTVILSG